MSECVEVWTFVEKKLKIAIPNYIKNVLTYCGYDNLCSISVIDEHDMDFIVTEVRKGGILEYFSDKTKHPLQGSVKSEQNFEFSRGHQKLLMVIVKLVRQNLMENGVDVLSVKQRKTMKCTCEYPKEPKANSTHVLKKSEPTSELLSFHEDIINVQAKLLKQTINSLFIHSYDLYEKNKECIGTKICNNLVYISYESPENQYLAEINCPYCAENITVDHISNEWNISNFIIHLKAFHDRDRVSSTDTKDRVSSTDTKDRVSSTDTKEPLQSHPATVPIVDNNASDDDKKLNLLKPTGKTDQLNKTIVGSPLAITSNSHVVMATDEDSTQEYENSQKNVNTFCGSNECRDGTNVHSVKDVQCLSAGSLSGTKNVVKEGDFVIFSAPKESYTKWPDSLQIVPHFIGQIFRIDVDDKIELRTLERSHDSKFIFVFMRTNASKVIYVEDIVQILQIPSRNRRHKLVFKDKSLLDFDI